MINPLDIDTLEVDFYWKDSPDDIQTGKIAFISTEEDYEYVQAKLDEEDPEWVKFDDRVFYYLFEYRERLTDYMDIHSQHDFVVL